MELIIELIVGTVLLSAVVSVLGIIWVMLTNW